MESTYPKWVSRGHGIGPVLCQNAAEEKALLDDWSEQNGNEVERAAAGSEITEVAAAREQLQEERAAAEEWFAAEQRKIEQSHEALQQAQAQLNTDRQRLEEGKAALANERAQFEQSQKAATAPKSEKKGG